MRDTVVDALQNGAPLGAGSARLVHGNHPFIENCETFAANWFGSEAALFIESGYKANRILFETLPHRHDVIIYDEMCHASMRDGIAASGAKAMRVAHNNLEAFGVALAQHKDRQCWLVVESLYSMNGDYAPLAELQTLALQYNAMLVVDEAHATGICGPTGKGCTESLSRENLITLHMGGKALGVSGAVICADKIIIDYLINSSRAFIYSTAPWPVQALAFQHALQLVDEAPERRKRLWELTRFAHEKLRADEQASRREKNYALSPIIPIILGSDETAIGKAAQLQAAGFDVRAIRPPTVPDGTARLRITINVEQSEEKILRLLCLL